MCGGGLLSVTKDRTFVESHDRPCLELIHKITTTTTTTNIGNACNLQFIFVVCLIIISTNVDCLQFATNMELLWKTKKKNPELGGIIFLLGFVLFYLLPNQMET